MKIYLKDLAVASYQGVRFSKERGGLNRCTFKEQFAVRASKAALKLFRLQQLSVILNIVNARSLSELS